MKKLSINMKNKKAVSPIIATVLLIMIVIVLAIIIIIWSQGFISELISKEILGNKKRLDEWCSQRNLEGLINQDGTFAIKNKGQVPIFAFNVKTVSAGDSNLERVSESLNPSYTLPFDIYLSSYDSIKVIPILLGTTDEGSTKEKPCPEATALIIK